MSMAVPRFITNKPGTTQKHFFAEFATLVSDTAYQAIVSKKVHQIYWDFKTHKITVKRHENMPDEANIHQRFKTVAKDVFHSEVNAPELFTVRNFIVQGDELIKPGMIMNDAWFYIMPDGSSQATTINIDDATQDVTARFSITINPFYSQATLHDAFQKQ